jgi:hypothetical protein
LRQNVNGVLQDVFQNTKMKKGEIVGKGSNTGTEMTDIGVLGWDPEKERMS